MSLDYSTDGGANWTINPYQTTPGGSDSTWMGNRYPNIGIYNPTSNTDPANAFIVQVGPALETGINSNERGWAKTFRSSFKLDGTLLNETYDNNSMSSQGNLNEWAAAGFYVTSLGTAWYVTTNSENSAATPVPANNVADNYSKYFIVKGDFNATGDSIDWTCTDTITPAWNTTTNGTTTDRFNIAGLPNMAWSLDGNTGYIVIMGSWGTNTMTRPYVLKTTDAGTTWTNVNDYDFSQNSIFQSGLMTWSGTDVRPDFGAFDLVVDMNDELRIFADISPGSTDHPDSLTYAFTHFSNHLLCEVATNGTGWDVNFIDSIYVDNHEYDAANEMSHWVRPQVSRSQDGSKIFYNWLGSAWGASTTREFPQAWAAGHDLTTDKWTAVKNLSLNTDADYVTAYPTVAVETIENNVLDYEIALVYATAPGNGALADGTAAPQYHFLREVGFDDAEFTLTQVVNSLSVNDIKSKNTEVSIYPNPTNGIVSINTDANNFNYTVVNLVGNMVAQNTVKGNNTTVDLTNNAKGVYFVTINTENGSVTKKVILTK
jgi:hypothetical protein